MEILSKIIRREPVFEGILENKVKKNILYSYSHSLLNVSHEHILSIFFVLLYTLIHTVCHVFDFIYFFFILYFSYFSMYFMQIYFVLRGVNTLLENLFYVSLHCF